MFLNFRHFLQNPLLIILLLFWNLNSIEKGVCNSNLIPDSVSSRTTRGRKEAELENRRNGATVETVSAKTAGLSRPEYGSGSQAETDASTKAGSPAFLSREEETEERLSFLLLLLLHHITDAHALRSDRQCGFLPLVRPQTPDIPPAIFPGPAVQRHGETRWVVPHVADRDENWGEEPQRQADVLLRRRGCGRERWEGRRRDESGIGEGGRIQTGTEECDELEGANAGEEPDGGW